MTDKFNNRAHTAAIFNIFKVYDTVWTTGMTEITHSWNTGLNYPSSCTVPYRPEVYGYMEGRMEINTCKCPAGSKYNVYVADIPRIQKQKQHNLWMTLPHTPRIRTPIMHISSLQRRVSDLDAWQ
jgi:hypothetical protein